MVFLPVVFGTMSQGNALAVSATPSAPGPAHGGRRSAARGRARRSPVAGRRSPVAGERRRRTRRNRRPGPPPITAADWASADRLAASRPDLSLLAVAPDAHDDEHVDGFAFVDVERDEWPPRDGPFGYITTVGTRRQARGRGLARTLLTHVLRAMRADGLRHAVLEVDADSPTGALGLHRSFGFTVTDRSMSFVKHL
ncbi:GNAT family N-acetyltransferase [Embleya sp. NPDC008237]|uniref:GNAT family N-acetyltransferase n=1 Tax=Embleya sp. NPDC008237 TaxID=3363978 RepID=UPI0036E59800